jgi:hypothetical protein
MEKEFKQYDSKEAKEQWMGSEKLIQIFRNGMRDCSIDDKLKIVYGFEQVLPQVAYL